MNANAIHTVVVHRSRVVATVLALALGGAACSASPDAASDANETENAVSSPMHAAFPARNADLARAELISPSSSSHLEAYAPSKPNGLQYNGGKVMLGTPNVYVVWYGTWPDSSKSFVSQFLQNVGGSSWYSTMTTYYDSANNHVSNALAYAGSTTDAYSRGKSLRASGIQGIVSDAISSGRLVKDTNGIYVVLTANDVTVSDDAPDKYGHVSKFCSDYCGWHTHATIGSADIKYAFIGDGDYCSDKSACLWSANAGESPSGDVALDTIVSVAAHEIVETVSDPDLDGWVNPPGQENGDLCAWQTGTTYPTANGYGANTRIAGHDYLIQENWINANGGSCVLGNPAPSLPAAPSGCVASVGCNDAVSVHCNNAQAIFELQRPTAGVYKTVSTDSSVPRFVLPTMSNSGGGADYVTYRTCMTTNAGRTCGSSFIVAMPHTACGGGGGGSDPPPGCYYDSFHQLHCVKVN